MRTRMFSRILHDRERKIIYRYKRTGYGFYTMLVEQFILDPRGEKKGKEEEKERKEKEKKKRKKETIRDVERDSAACSTMHASNGVVLCHPGAARMTFLPKNVNIG